MLDEIERLAKILEVPGLEPDTTSIINATIREKLTKYREQAEKSAPTDGNLPLSPNLFHEWLNGPQSEQEGG